MATQKMKIENLVLNQPLHLGQTNLIINTSNVYVCENVKFYKSYCHQAVVLKSSYDENGRDVFVFGMKVNPILRNNLRINQ